MNTKSEFRAMIEQAEKERQLCEEKIVEYTARIQEIDGFLAYVERSLSEFIKVKDKNALNLPMDEVQKSDNANMSVAQVAENVLQKFGKPMKIKDMVNTLWEDGFRRYVTKQKLYTALFATMKRRNRKFFKGKKPGVFGLVEWKETENAPS